MEETVDASEDERGVGVAMLLVLLLLGVAVGFDLEWKYFFKSCRMTDSISYGRTFPLSDVSCLPAQDLLFKKGSLSIKSLVMGSQEMVLEVIFGEMHIGWYFSKIGHTTCLNCGGIPYVLARKASESWSLQFTRWIVVSIRFLLRNCCFKFFR